MRQTRKSQLALGEARIEDIKLDHKSRDDIPAVLLGLQHLYSHEETREKLFSLLEEHILPGTNRKGVALTLVRHAARLQGNATTLSGTMTF